MGGTIMMKSIIALMGLMVMVLAGEGEQTRTIRAAYDVSYGIFGTIGTANAVLKKQKNTYAIDIALAATGLAKTLSGGRREHHHSEGIIRDGKLISRRYEVVRQYGSTKVVKRYVIDQEHHKVYKSYIKYQQGKIENKEKKVLDFFSQDDLLTLYFNLDHLIIDKHRAGTYTFHAVGAEKQHGKVTVIVPSNTALPAYREDLCADADWYATVVIHQKIFMSKEGRLELAVGKDGITQQALLKDLILFGDIRAVRTK